MLAGYLIVTAILLVYVSYSSYKIRINTTVRMPQTYTISAGLDMDEYDEAEYASGDIGGIYLTSASVELTSYSALVGLAPGTSATTYADSSTVEEIAKNHKFVVNVSNKQPDNENGYCKLDLSYNLEVETTGRLPLTFALKDTSSGAVVATAVINRSATEAACKANFVDNGNNLAKFSLSGATLNTNTYEIFIGWNDDDVDSSSMDLCREVDKITIRAKIWAEKPGATWTETDAPTITRTTEEAITVE